MPSLFLLLFVLSITYADVNQFDYSDYSKLLSTKKGNLYDIKEISNVCFENGNFQVFTESEQSGADLVAALSSHELSLSVDHKNGYKATVAKKEGFANGAVTILLYSEQKDDYMLYRLTNSLIYLIRSNVDLSYVDSVYISVAQSITENQLILFDKYATIISDQLGKHLLPIMGSFCSQQLIMVEARMEMRDLFYQADALFIQKAIYKGEPKYPIPPRSKHILVNFRKESPKFVDDSAIQHFLNIIYKGRSIRRYMDFSSSSSSEILSALQDTDVFITIYGVPYSVFIEIQPDYYHDTTTSILAYDVNVYPIILTDVYSEVPKECRREDELIRSDEEPCRTILKSRDINFDIKSMTQSMAQADYYLANYKMKVSRFWECLYNETSRIPELNNSLFHRCHLYAILLLLLPYHQSSASYVHTPWLA